MKHEVEVKRIVSILKIPESMNNNEIMMNNEMKMYMNNENVVCAHIC